MEKTFVGIREIDLDTFRKFKALAVERKLKLGDAITEAMNTMLSKREEKRNLKKVFKIKPFDFGKGSERLSEEIDSIIYK